jgi:chorismate-pyruvate lyase
MPVGVALENSNCDCDDFLDSLLRIFYADSSRLGQFTEVAPIDTPQPYAMLLAHQRHMTVTVEAFHSDRVDVQVLRSSRQDDSYSREILLRLQNTAEVIQFGIVRIHLHRIAEELKREILEEKKPLGRILIEHQVLREVEFFKLWQVRCGFALAQFFSVPLETETFGRTAVIHCDGEPAIELLEIVRPVFDWKGSPSRAQ